MQKELKINRFWSSNGRDVSSVIYESDLIGYLETKSGLFSFNEDSHQLVFDPIETPLFKTYSMRYEWFKYKGFLSINQVPVHIGNRNISTAPCAILGSSPTEVMNSIGVYNGEKVMKYFYEMFYYPISNGILKVNCLFTDSL